MTIADLIGDIDPIKAARERLDLSDEGVIHYGIIPRTNRGIFAINELPDLQPRIQVGLLNILEEKDFQIRGFPVRLPLDCLLVFSANPEDYTNRGNIITPLKDRIDSQIITHYPQTVEDAMAITTQEAWTDARRRRSACPQFVREIVEEVAFQARKSEFVDQIERRVGAAVRSRRYENLVSNAERRGLRTGEERWTPRMCDLYAARPGDHRQGRAGLRGRAGGADDRGAQPRRQGGEGGLRAALPDGLQVEGQGSGREGAGAVQRDLGSLRGRRAHRDRRRHAVQRATTRSCRRCPASKALAKKHLKAADEEELATVMEFVLDGLHQNSLVAKEALDQRVRYSDMLANMLKNMKG